MSILRFAIFLRTTNASNWCTTTIRLVDYSKSILGRHRTQQLSLSHTHKVFVTHVSSVEALIDLHS